MKILNTASYVIVISFVIVLLVVGKPFLVPLFLAVVLWYLINSINDLVKRIPAVKRYIPNGVTLGFSFILIIVIMVLFGNLVASNIDAMVEKAPNYKVNIEQQLQRILAVVGLEDKYTMGTLTTELNLNNYIRNLINSVSSVAQRFFLVLIYVIFLLVEQHTFPKKIAALSWSKERKEKSRQILSQIHLASRSYIAVKFGASVLTAVLSYIVMHFVGLDFPVFWAFLVFLLNFIPTIGSFVATIFPSLVALLQFDTLAPFLIVLLGVMSIQIMIGSFLEPKLLGDSLNISPFVIILSLVLWGLIWGVVGMLLCVPLTAIMIVVMGQFPNTRPIAILLSRNGKVGKEQV